MRTGKINEALILTYYVYEADGYTLLSEAVGTHVATLLLNGATNAATVTLVETDTTGKYTATFTPDAIGTWEANVYVPTNTFHWTEEIEVFHRDVDDLVLSVVTAAGGTTQKSTWTDKEKDKVLYDLADLIKRLKAVVDRFDTVGESQETVLTSIGGLKESVRSMATLIAIQPDNKQVAIIERLQALTEEITAIAEVIPMLLDDDKLEESINGTDED